MEQYGLIGRNITYSFSEGYFLKKFQREGREDCRYRNFDLKEISEVDNVFKIKNLRGLNVTIPYKEAVIPFLHELSAEAREVGAVNVIQFRQGKRVGYNTDIYGFEQSFIKKLDINLHKKALILGTGGASKAIAYVLRKNKISYQQVSRNGSKKHLSYDNLTGALFDEYKIIINCTPVGTFPEVKQKPQIPYHFLTHKHYLYDLIYNPGKTAFLEEGIKKGAIIQNGLKMLELQAEKSWEIWNKKKQFDGS